VVDVGAPRGGALVRYARVPLQALPALLTEGGLGFG
jgi:hypothetical protein